jgi:hypothetical protein
MRTCEMSYMRMTHRDEEGKKVTEKLPVRHCYRPQRREQRNAFQANSMIEKIKPHDTPHSDENGNTSSYAARPPTTTLHPWRHCLRGRTVAASTNPTSPVLRAASVVGGSSQRWRSSSTSGPTPSRIEWGSDHADPSVFAPSALEAGQWWGTAMTSGLNAAIRRRRGNTSRLRPLLLPTATRASERPIDRRK